MVRVLSLAVVAVALTSVSARPHLAAKIPNGSAHSDPFSGLKCDAFGHTDCVHGGPRNDFGLDFKAAGFEWTKELCEMDSDGDGLTNGQEMGDPCCLWTPESSNPEGFRVTMLSNPGDASDDGAREAPSCEDATAAPSAPATVTEPEVVETPVVTEAAAVTEPAVETSAIMTTEVPATDAPAVTEAKVRTESVKATGKVDVMSTEAMSDDTEPAYPASCSPYNSSCTGDDSCCDSSDQCTDAPWEGANEKRCLPRPPVCYNDGERCAGADGYEFVPYAACCDSKQDCVENKDMGWGRFCVSPAVDYSY